MKNQPFVRVSELHKDFKMGETTVKALNGVSIGIERGSFTVIMGPSGSGKSTLLYLIGGLDWPTSGAIHVDDEEIETMDENTLAIFRRNKVGFIFQSFNLIASMAAEENVSFPLRFSGINPAERKQRSQKQLELVGLSDRMTHKPTELSGGQQQRVAVARALINDPPLILADEPTGNLDSFSGLAIMQLLSDLHKAGKTIIVVTHDPRMRQFATNTVFLLDGSIVSEVDYKNATELLTQPFEKG
ncbi:MAG: macrolide ABC transporter ATP-binding protein [Chloroflexi bacterium HGW-Chloroflexi-4]|jgi:putative ABC transport system ATP-binding protein|nr:MAG: macrolide ABC transporter ATP-binding protein [Chloroflexi bacterium HGW-Chloroflexi-7]PKN97685.1 MAG: macrolide ABC transporter ATP-binding protein [Chloroflexi bacterium HGW-Chloroflexi-4]